jgi:hypothetical protein
MPRLITNTGLYQAQMNRPILKTVRSHDLPLEPCAILICGPLDFYIFLTSFHLTSFLLQNLHPDLRIIKHSLSHLHLDIKFHCFFPQTFSRFFGPAPSWSGLHLLARCGKSPELSYLSYPEAGGNVFLRNVCEIIPL